MVPELYLKGTNTHRSTICVLFMGQIQSVILQTHSVILQIQNRFDADWLSHVFQKGQ